jgi:hypothetical protein
MYEANKNEERSFKLTHTLDILEPLILGFSLSHYDSMKMPKISQFNYTLSSQTFRHIRDLRLSRMYEKNTIFWDVTPCIMIEVYRRSGATYCLHLRDKNISQGRKQQAFVTLVTARLLGLLFYPEDGGSTFLRNFSKRLPDYMMSHARR